MVIANFGVEVSEAELRRLCDCTFDGTTALKAVDAARQLGFTKTTKHNLSLTELETLIADGHFPIVFADLTPINGYFQAHAFVVLTVNQFSVQVLDPAKGIRLIARDVFDLAWKLRLRLTILVKR
jgi:ABC-type bacteriocin/lantibiotic exporter with double-glycine peptidase domain